MTAVDLTTMTDVDLAQLAVDVRVEQRLREIPATISVLNLDYLAAKGIAPGQEWVQPTGAFDAYPADWQVTHNSKTWTSLTSSNVWEPGVSGWREVVAGDAPPQWTQPMGSTDAYNTGDKVTYNGVVYTSLIDANVWAPDSYPQGWQADPPA